MGRKYAQVRSLAARVDMRTMRLCQWDIFEGLQSAGPRTSLLVAALFHEHVCHRGLIFVLPNLAKPWPFRSFPGTGVLGKTPDENFLK
jgi:hypothetical protein